MGRHVRKNNSTLLTRKGFLQGAATSAAGAALLGAPALISGGCGGRAEQSHKPNVILVILDTLRKDHVGAYGNDLMRTPTLDAVAREGLIFTRAHPDAMPTIPARRAIHTGFRTWPVELPANGWTPIPAGQATLAEILRNHGYRTLICTDLYHAFIPSGMNFDRGFDEFREIRGQEQDHYRDPSLVSEEEMDKYLPVTPDQIRQYLANTQGRESEEDWFAPKVFMEATELLEQASQGEQPFFLVADCYDPHEPWDPPQEYISLYDEGYDGPEPIDPLYKKDDYLTNRQLMRMRALYAGEVTLADRWLGHFLKKAHQLGLMDNTLLIVISDHGHALGEHGYTGKLFYRLYPELTDIVLMIRHPEGKAAGKTSEYYASTHDVAPTIMGFLGIEPPEAMDGQDLSVLFEGKEPEPRDHFTSGYRKYVCCRDERRVMFCRTDRANAELYDAINDPQQRTNLVEEEPQTVQRMFEEYVLKDADGRLPTF